VGLAVALISGSRTLPNVTARMEAAMAQALNFESALVCWDQLRGNPEDDWGRFETAEQFLLDHTPRSTQEAARVVQVLVEQGGERRSDDRDLEALRRLRQFLEGLAPGGAALSGPDRHAA
jgi:hypothetical protein